MSLLFPDKLRIHLAPGHLVVARTRKAAVLHVEAKQVVAGAGLEWRALLETLTAMLDTADPALSSATITLSSRLAPLIVMAWCDEAMSPESQALLAAARFSASHGGAPVTWECVAASSGFGQPWVASGVQREFVIALKSMLDDARVKVTSIVPLALDLFNRHRAGLPARAPSWLLVSEYDRLVCWYCEGRMPRECISLPLPADGDEPVGSLLRRETVLRGMPVTSADMFVTASHPLGPLAERSVQRLFPFWRCEDGVSSSFPLHWLGGG